MESKKSTHDNLLDALRNLDRLMNDDGKAVAIGLQAYLKKYDCAYGHDTAKYLYEQKIIGRHKDSTHKNPLIYWNKSRPPSSAMVYQIIEAVKDARKTREEKAKRKKFDSGPTELEILMKLRGEACNDETRLIKERKYLKKKIQAQEIYIQNLSKKINNLKNHTR